MRPGPLLSALHEVPSQLSAEPLSQLEAASQPGSEKRKQKAQIPQPWLQPRRGANRPGPSPHPHPPRGRRYLERRPQGRRGRGREAKVFRSGTLGSALSAARVTQVWVQRCAERGRQGAGRTGRSPLGLLASPEPPPPPPAPCATPSRSPRAVSASPDSPPPPRRWEPPFAAHPGLARLSASASRSVLGLFHHLYLALPSSVPPSVSLHQPGATVTCRGLWASLCVPGVCRPHCFSCFSVLPRLASSARCLSGSGSFSRALSRSLPISVSSLPLPAASLPISASQSLPAAVGLPHCPRASGAPLGASRRPSLSRAFPALAPSARARQTPSPCQITMKSPCDPKAPCLPRRNRSSTPTPAATTVPHAVPWGALEPTPSGL